MSIASKATLKRFGRNFLGNVIGGAVAGGLFYLKKQPEYIFVAPIVSAGINAVGKWIREKFSIDKLPF